MQRTEKRVRRTEKGVRRTEKWVQRREKKCTLGPLYISATRGHASQPKVLAMTWTAVLPSSRVRCSPDKHYIGNV